MPETRQEARRTRADRRRLDVLLVERGLYPTRAQAQVAILAGRVRVAGASQVKPGMKVPAGADITVQEGEEFVSRGGHKLAHALARFPIEVQGHVVVDVGASTGGFTDVWLRRGARRVYAVDVGRGLLAWRLRHDPRVVCLEGVNARYLRPDMFSEAPSRFSVDVSFISLGKIWPALVPCLDPGAQGVALVKPQFEAGPRLVGKGGVVRDPAVHVQVLHKAVAEAAAHGLGARGLEVSPVLGPAGNVEFLLWLAVSHPGDPLDLEGAVAQGRELRRGGGRPV